MGRGKIFSPRKVIKKWLPGERKPYNMEKDNLQQENEANQQREAGVRVREKALQRSQLYCLFGQPFPTICDLH